jgi:hypothetical protein
MQFILNSSWRTARTTENWSRDVATVHNHSYKTCLPTRNPFSTLPALARTTEVQHYHLVAMPGPILNVAVLGCGEVAQCVHVRY